MLPNWRERVRIFVSRRARKFGRGAIAIEGVDRLQPAGARGECARGRRWDRGGGNGGAPLGGAGKKIWHSQTAWRLCATGHEAKCWGRGDLLICFRADDICLRSVPRL